NGPLDSRHFRISPDGKWVTVSDRAGLALHDLSTGKRGEERAGREPVRFLSGRELLVSGGGAQSIWDVQTGKETRIAEVVPPGTAALGFSRDGTKVLLRGRAKGKGKETLLLWDRASRKEEGALPESAGVPHFWRLSDDGRLLAYRQEN